MSQTSSSTEVAAQTPPDQPRVVASGWSRFVRRDVGQLPVIVALVIIAIFFNWRSGGFFLTSRNLTFLALQTATVGTISLGAVLVLLIGEIDLSLAAVSNLCGAVMVTLSVYHNFNAVFAMLAALVVGAIVGLINGVLVAILRVPSFIVTLAGLIFYSGLLLHVLLPQTTIRLTDATITGLASNYVPDPFGVIVPVIAIAIWAGASLYTRQIRMRSGLAIEPLTVIIGRVLIAIVAVILAALVFESYLGVPVTTAILISLIILFWLILRFTAFGRHVYAVGGNAEASRRAGINVVGIRIALFMLASTLAAVAGILESSRTISASAQIEPTLLLDAIAAAVIGGVSLFGGRGSVWAVVLGALVIGSLANGLTLLSQGSDIQQMVEGSVLIIAVAADAILRRRSATGVR